MYNTTNPKFKENLNELTNDNRKYSLKQKVNPDVIKSTFKSTKNTLPPDHSIKNNSFHNFNVMYDQLQDKLKSINKDKSQKLSKNGFNSDQKAKNQPHSNQFQNTNPDDSTIQANNFNSTQQKIKNNHQKIKSTNQIHNNTINNDFKNHEFLSYNNYDNKVINEQTEEYQINTEEQQKADYNEIQQSIEQILEDTRQKNDYIKQLEQQLQELNQELSAKNNEKEDLLLKHNQLFQESENFQRIIAQFEDLELHKQEQIKTESND